MSESPLQRDRALIALLQEPLPYDPEPFKSYARRLGVSQRDVLGIIDGYLKKGVIRRLCGVLKHDKAGFAYNAMVAFDVPPESRDSVGEALAGFSFVTHCYCRTPYPDWPYSLYAMVHAKHEADFEGKLNEIRVAVPCADYIVLPTVREYKKTSFHLPDPRQ